MNNTNIQLWGTDIGAVSWIPERSTSVFQYYPDFIRSDVQLSPLVMPLKELPYKFPELSKNTFHGLPGLLADSLPDRFGATLINTWLSSQERTIDSFNPIDMLCMIGNNGMGALQFSPQTQEFSVKAERVAINKLMDLLKMILYHKKNNLEHFPKSEDFRSVLSVCGVIGGSRPKAVLAWNPDTSEFRSGQARNLPGFQDWIIKFTGITKRQEDKNIDPIEYGKIEFAYYLMATDSGIKMSPSRLYDDGVRCHFLSKRFDRDDNGRKVHMQSLSAITHTDFNDPGLFSYEEVIFTMRRLGLPFSDIEQMVLRAFFNVITRNQDDHPKNTAFLMDRDGCWHLSPAFDLTYAYDPSGYWTSMHQMFLNGKRNGFEICDLITFAAHAGIKTYRAKEMVNRVITTIKKWPEFANSIGLPEKQIVGIQNAHRINI